LRKISKTWLSRTQQQCLRQKRKRVYGYRIGNYSLDNIDNAATTRKAMPVQKRSPVRKYTTMATRMAGISTKKSLMRIMITKPMMTKITSAVRSSPKLPRIERMIVKRIVLSKNIPQENSASRS